MCPAFEFFFFFVRDGELDARHDYQTLARAFYIRRDAHYHARFWASSSI